MKTIPILFSGEMVNAILDGRKTQTRRQVKGSKYRPVEFVGGKGDWDNPKAWGYEDCYGEFWTLTDGYPCPYGRVGDLLWVRETFVIESNEEYRYMSQLPQDGRPIKMVETDNPRESYSLIPHYRATEPEPHIVPYDIVDGHDDRTRWKPSIFMPRWASRITLEIVDVRVERLQDLSGNDCIAEGAFPDRDWETTIS